MGQDGNIYPVITPDQMTPVWLLQAWLNSTGLIRGNPELEEKVDKYWEELKEWFLEYHITADRRLLLYFLDGCRKLCAGLQSEDNNDNNTTQHNTSKITAKEIARLRHKRAKISVDGFIFMVKQLRLHPVDPDLWILMARIVRWGEDHKEEKEKLFNFAKELEGPELLKQIENVLFKPKKPIAKNEQQQ